MTDKQIRNLFETEQRLDRQLALVRARISAARRDYSERNGLLAYPSIDAMRKAVANG